MATPAILHADKFYGLPWWITWNLFFIAVVVLTLLLLQAVSSTRAALIALIAIEIQLLTDTANTFLFFNGLGVGGEWDIYAGERAGRRGVSLCWSETCIISAMEHLKN
jgi:hypothetical protein